MVENAFEECRTSLSFSFELYPVGKRVVVVNPTLGRQAANSYLPGLRSSVDKPLRKIK